MCKGGLLAIDLDETIDQDLHAATVCVHNKKARSNIILVCEHASNFIPEEFQDLGLSGQLVRSHIAWDPGALDVAKLLSRRLKAVLVAQNVSRLLYDCNRPPEAVGAVPEISEIYPIVGNRGLSKGARAERVERFYLPFRDALGAVVAQKRAKGPSPILITIHSFTPIFKGQQRAVQLGVLHDADARLADAVLARAAGKADFVVARNQPYGPGDGVTHTLKLHGMSHGLLNVMIEIRNDLIATGAQQEAMAQWLADVLKSAIAQTAQKEAKGA